ncbi:MAG: HEAT repeat domain-containing protein, partial [Bdellovibrionales bacterium]|nr:HEAT repeat domain-containing protein [Bdellovibrionales bacterium]
LLERGFKTGNQELQKQALSSASEIGEAGLPLLERGFKTGDRYLQWQALGSAGRIGEAAIPMLKRVLTDKSLSTEMKAKIRDLFIKTSNPTFFK